MQKTLSANASEGFTCMSFLIITKYNKNALNYKTHNKRSFLLTTLLNHQLQTTLSKRIMTV